MTKPPRVDVMLGTTTCRCSAQQRQESSGDGLDLEQIRETMERVLKLLLSDLPTMAGELQEALRIIEWAQHQYQRTDTGVPRTLWEVATVADLRTMARRLDLAYYHVVELEGMFLEHVENLRQVAKLLFEAGEEVA